MRRKFFILVESYFQQRDYRRYGIELLQASGLDVEVWEVFRPYRKHYAESYVPPDPAQFSGLRHFGRMDEVLRELRRVRPADAVLLPMSDRWETGPIYRQLNRQGAYFGSVTLAGIAASQSSRRFRLGNWENWRDRIYLRLPYEVRRTAPPRFMLLCGGTSLEPVTKRLSRAAHVWTHALDYDIALALGRGNGSSPHHIVFLDEYVPFHPDYLTMGISAPNTAGDYYPKLLRLFEALEARWRLPVVVAAHPRAKYAGGPDYFAGRRVVQGETGVLVRDAALVITHCSTSNVFTAIYRKPLLVVTTHGLVNSYYGPFIKATAETFGAPLLNLDTEWNSALDQRPQVDAMRYAKLVETLVKRPGTPEKNTWQILAGHLHARPLA
jgi:hypothetical protein